MTGIEPQAFTRFRTMRCTDAGTLGRNQAHPTRAIFVRQIVALIKFLSGSGPCKHDLPLPASLQ